MQNFIFSLSLTYNGSGDILHVWFILTLYRSFSRWRSWVKVDGHRMKSSVFSCGCMLWGRIFGCLSSSLCYCQSALPTGCGVDNARVVLNKSPSMDMLCTLRVLELQLGLGCPYQSTGMGRMPVTQPMGRTGTDCPCCIHSLRAELD